MEVKNPARRFTVIKKLEFAEFDVVEGQTVCIGSMEGEVDFIHMDGEAGRLIASHSRGARLRNSTAGEGQHREDQQIGYGRFIEHIADLSGI